MVRPQVALDGLVDLGRETGAAEADPAAAQSDVLGLEAARDDGEGGARECNKEGAGLSLGGVGHGGRHRPDGRAELHIEGLGCDRAIGGCPHQISPWMSETKLGKPRPVSDDSHPLQVEVEAKFLGGSAAKRRVHEEHRRMARSVSSIAALRPGRCQVARARCDHDLGQGKLL